MKLVKAKIERFRSIIDTGWFEIETEKTILVGPNEAGKSALLLALQQLNPPESIGDNYEPLRDYPRSSYDDDIIHHKVNVATTPFVTGIFILSDDERAEFPDEYKNLNFVYWKTLDNKPHSELKNTPPALTFKDIEKDLLRLKSHFLSTANSSTDTEGIANGISTEYDDMVNDFSHKTIITTTIAKEITTWLDKNITYLDENNKGENNRFDSLKEKLQIPETQEVIAKKCLSLLPKFVLFNNYFRIHPLLDIGDLVNRRANNNLDARYDYGNLCLFKYLGFTPEELIQAVTDANTNKAQKGFEAFRTPLDERDYKLNAATIRLTRAIQDVWNPDLSKDEASKLRIKADGLYFKVVVEDELGVEVELDQRSEGFQWLVSFFIVFFAESDGAHKGAILLLDEPGLSLHALKQAEFRKTLSKLSKLNQTLYTTHSPFLIGSDELDKVRVVEMHDRKKGTIVNTTLTATDSGALLPLQEALGYDLAQSLFFHEKNLVLEGITDMWYLEAFSSLQKESDKTSGLDEKIALIPANSASKVVYYSTILNSQKLKVSALLDSDSAGDNAVEQDNLVVVLGKNNIIRTKDAYVGEVKKPEIEDLFRNTLVKIAKDNLEWDVEEKANSQVTRSIVDIFAESYKKDFSKLKLAKAFIRWSATNSIDNLEENERKNAISLIELINKSFKGERKSSFSRIKEAEKQKEST